MKKLKVIAIVFVSLVLISITTSVVSYASLSKQEICVIQMKLQSEGKSVLDMKNWDKGANWEPYCQAKIYFEETK